MCATVAAVAAVAAADVSAAGAAAADICHVVCHVLCVINTPDCNSTVSARLLTALIALHHLVTHNAAPTCHAASAAAAVVTSGLMAYGLLCIRCCCLCCIDCIQQQRIQARKCRQGVRQQLKAPLLPLLGRIHRTEHRR